MTTNGLQVFLSPAVMPITQLGAGGESVGSHDYKWPSSLLTTYSRVGYPSWALKGRQLGVMTTNDLQVFLPPAAVLVTKLGR